MEIRIGPAGWIYPDWKGRVYPAPEPAGFDALGYLSGTFPVIEINSTFYRPAPARMAEGWARRTPGAFLFTAKVWEKFTHEPAGPTAADARVFLEGLSPLLESRKLGALLLQFPWFFKDGPAARERLKKCAELLGGRAPLVVEVRHRSWLGALDFLRERGLSFCNIDQPRSATAITGTRHVTGPPGYVRLHGRNAQAWFKKSATRDEKYDYLYSPAELSEWVEAIRSLQADQIFVILNNHFQGKAVVNALQLARALGQELSVPEPLKRFYGPQLEATPRPLPPPPPPPDFA
jgi:uncharacterized protein YecE (DUF72 family)